MKPIPGKTHDVNGVKWLDRLHQAIQSRMTSGEFNNDALALQMGISERHFFRRMKKLTGSSPQQYIRKYRLNVAKEYMEKGTFRTVIATADAIGYGSPSYFISQFEKEFGQKPLEVLQQHGWR